LMMDNASIHKGVVVSDALKRVDKRLGVAYQPPYMPTVNPVELVNNQLKAVLKKTSLSGVVRQIKQEIIEEKKKKKKNGLHRNSMDPQGGVVFDAPIEFDSMSLRESIEFVLDRLVSKDAVTSFVRHCGWK